MGGNPIGWWCVEGGTGKAEDAKLQDAGEPEAVPRKMRGRKRNSLLESMEIG
jgi:hypothetical protein